MVAELIFGEDCKS